jgi:hypothetical protein
VNIPARTPLKDSDPLTLDLLKLATETMLAHPQAIPPDLLAMLDTYAADLRQARDPDAAPTLPRRERDRDS